MNIRASKPVQGAATEVDAPASAGDVTQLKDPASIPRPRADALTRRASNVARYFRKSRDRAAREQPDAGARAPLASEPVDSSRAAKVAAATSLAVQSAENEGFAIAPPAQDPRRPSSAIS